MGTFRNTNEINKEYADNRVASPVAKSAWDKFSMWSMGMDRYGNQKGAGSKMLSGLTNTVLFPLPYMSARNVRQKYKGEAGGAKIRNQAKNRAIESGVSQALAVATLGTSGLISGSAGAAGGAAASSAGSAAGGAAGSAAGGAGTALSTEAAKTVGTEGAKTAGTALGKEALKTTSTEVAKEVGEEAVKGGIKQFGKELLQEIGGEKTKLILDFVKGFKGKGDVAGKEFLKSFYAENKKQILKLGADEVKGLLSTYKGKYSQYKDDTQMTSTYSTMDGETSYRDANNKSTMMFKKGGKVEGKSHDEGGEKATVGDTNIEVEGGEEIFSVKDTKKMESFMKKKDAKGLGKFVMGTMAKHRDNPQPTYAEGGTSDLGKDYDYLNKTSKFESGDMKSKAVGYDKNGGTSYGTIQLASKQKAVNEFINFLNSSDNPKYKEIAKELSSVTNWNTGSKTGAAVDACNKAVDMYPEAMSSAEKEYAHKIYTEPVLDYVAEKYGIDKENISDEMKAMIASRSIQHGVSGAKRVISNSWGSNAKNLSDSELISSVYKEVGDNVDKYFSSSTPEVKASVKNRMKVESNELIKSIGVTYDDEKTNTKYQAYKQGNQYSNPLTKELAETVASLSEEDEYTKNADALIKQQDILKTKTNETLFLLEKYERGELSPPNGKTIQDVRNEYQDLKSQSYSLQADIIREQGYHAVAISEKVNPKIEALREDLENSYTQGKISKEDYDRNSASLINLKTKTDKYYSDSKFLNDRVDEINYAKSSGKKELLETQVDNLTYQIKQLRESKVADYDSHIKANSIIDREKALAEAKQGLIDYDAELGELRNPLKEFTYTDLSIDELSIDYGVNYTQDEKTKFEKDAEEFERSTYVDDLEVDAETDYNVDKVIMSEDVLKQVLQQRDAKQEATGLKGVIEKFGGTDKVLELTGMYAAYKSATTPTPEQRKSDAWMDNMARMKDRTQLGLDNATKTLYQRNAERTYAYDVKNIGRTATSGQAALGALGAASARKYDADLTMAAKDAMVRDANQAAYTSALAVDENMTQEMWKRNVYDEASRKRELKSSLIGKAVSNMRDDLMYDKQYGDGSMYDQLMKESLEEKKNTNEALRIAKAQKMIDANQWTEEEAIDYYSKKNQPEPAAPKSSIATMIENTFNKIKK